MTTPIYTVVPASIPASPELAPAFTDVATSHISDNLHRLSGVTGLNRYHRNRKLVGTAFTVKVRPGDNLPVYQALTMMQPGHALVIDGAGHTDNVLGELIMLYARQRGCVGFVVDGAIRDSAAFHEADFPCYARAVTHRGPFKNGPGAINVPVTIGGQIVNPGDILVGDADGIVTFPQSAANELLAAAKATARKEEEVKAEIATGRVEQAWLQKVLASAGL